MTNVINSQASKLVATHAKPGREGDTLCEMIIY
jgi:hypothetical protein